VARLRQSAVVSQGCFWDIVKQHFRNQKMIKRKEKEGEKLTSLKTFRSKAI